MEAELVDGARHVAPWVKFYPEFCCLCPILLQLLLVDRVVRVDDAEKDMKTVKESFVLQGFSCSISSVGITKVSCSNLVDYETQLVSVCLNPLPPPLFNHCRVGPPLLDFQSVGKMASRQRSQA